jgi:ankyrin repeat protein
MPLWIHPQLSEGATEVIFTTLVVGIFSAFVLWTLLQHLRPSVVDALLNQKQGDPMSRRGGFNDDSLLQCAVKSNQNPSLEASARAKLASGSDPNSCNRAGQTALHVAAIWGSMGVGRALIEAGADVNRRNKISGGTPLMMAANRDQTEFARILLASGADPTLADMGGNVAYEMAQNSDLRELLGGPSAKLCDAVEEGDLQKVMAVVSEKPELVVAKNGDGDTPLTIAIEAGHWEIALWLIAHRNGAGLANQSGADGGGAAEYPLHLAARAKQAELVTALLGGGADPNLKSIRNNEYVPSPPLSISLLITVGALD